MDYVMKMISKVKGDAIAWNDANYAVIPTVCGKKVLCPFYKTWSCMISRAYSKSYKSRQPTYDGVTVCESWLQFSNFKTWMLTKNWEGLELDKDIIKIGNNVYSPEFCCFVSTRVNLLLLDRRAKRGEFPIGVDLHRGKFRAQCRDGSGKKLHLGTFLTQESAHKAYVDFKVKVIDSVIATLTDAITINGLLRHRSKMLNI